jgi:YD repeat-containing protein
MTDGAGRSIAYTAFNMAATVTMGTASDAFTYDSAHNRVTSTLTGVGTVTYLNALGGTSEKLVSGSATTWHDYVLGDGRIVAEKFSGAVTQVSYFVSDHLGSVHLIADSTGTVIERLSYDAWGKRRNPDGSDATGCTAIASGTTRGYTGQEHIDALCAINYNDVFGFEDHCPHIF